MSAGVFARAKYLRDNGTAVHPIRVQPETIATWNAEPAPALNSDISARANGTRRGLGLIARRVRIKFPDTGAPTGYKAGGTTTVPVLTPAAYAALSKNQTVQYLGVNCIVIGKTPEYVN